MRYTTFGRTGLEVSVAGLGCGGHSRLGTAYGKDDDHAASLVRLAVEHGVNYIDTAASYGTEPAVAKALADLNRDELVISTKAGIGPDEKGGDPIAADALIARLDHSLATLGIDTVDVYHLHGLVLDQLDHALEHIVPALQRARAGGKVRHLAVSEAFIPDPGHAMFQRLLAEATEAFDVYMVGHNLLNFSARQRVFTATRQHDIAVEVMFAVRRALSRPEALRELVAELIEQGKVDIGAVDRDNPLGFLAEHEVDSVTDAAYRFCVHEPGCHVVLFGTGNPEHLKQNIASINGEPLPTAVHDRLTALFGAVDHVSGN